MRKLSEKQILILKCLENYPQGAFLWQVDKGCNILSKQSTYQFLKALIKRGLVRKFDHLYFLEVNKNAEIFTQAQGTMSGLSKEQDTYLPIQQLTQPRIQARPNPKLQRMHAIQAYAKIHRGIYEQIESRLAEAGIGYNYNKALKQYTFSWQGTRMRYTTRKLIVWVKQIEASIYITTEELNSEALKQAGSLIESLTDATKIRLQRTLEKRAIISLSYKEFAFTDNELARRATQKGGMISIAYDRLTGKSTLWFDESFTAEMETNRDPLHSKLRKWGQAMQDTDYDPMEAERLHTGKEDMLRDEIAKIKKLLAPKPEPQLPAPPESLDMRSYR